MAENFIPAPNAASIRAQLGITGEVTQAADNTANPTTAKLIESLNEEIKKQQVLADEALPATRKAAKKNQYLYHYAGKSRREQIAQGGIRGGQAQGGGKAFFFLDPEGHSISSFVNPEEMDLYRTKVTPEILDQLKVDPKLAIKDGVGSAVYLEGDLAKKGFAAELVSKNVKVGDNGIITFSKTKPFSKSLSIGSPVEMKTIAGAPKRMPLQKATAATQAKIASSVAMETVEDNVGRIVQRSGATSRLLGAATEASSHVAGGAAKSGLLRQAAAAATILKTIT